MGNMRFRRQTLPVGEDEIPVLVASEGEQPKAVFMSYDSFVELAATLYTAIETLRAAGIDPAVLGTDDEDDDPTEDDLEEFAAWDDGFATAEDEPRLRLVVSA